MKEAKQCTIKKLFFCYQWVSFVLTDEIDVLFFLIINDHIIKNYDHDRENKTGGIINKIKNDYEKIYLKNSQL